MHTTEDAYEDGYNLGLLEAMATGMPVVATASVTTPVVDGVNGFVSDDLTALRERLALLLADRDEAARLGRAARATVAERFPLAAFVARWDAVFGEAVGRPSVAVSARPALAPAPIA